LRYTTVDFFEFGWFITGSIGSALVQSGIAGYGAVTIGKAAKVYLEAGCTWGQFGASTVIQEILATVPKETILHRLQQELGTQFRGLN
jgi:uncharacterized protein